MRYLWWCLCLLPLLVFADVDTKDGTAITNATTLDGETGIDTADGQTVVSSGPTVNEDFADCNDITDVENSITCAGGVAGGSTEYDDNTGYHNTALSTANHYAEIDGEWDGGYLAMTSPVVRCDGNTTSSTGYYVNIDDSDDDLFVVLEKFSGGTGTYVGEDTLVGQQLTSGTSYKYRLSVNSSNQFSLWIDADDDGTYQADEKLTNFVTDSSYTGTYVGVHVHRNDTDSKIDWLQGDDE